MSLHTERVAISVADGTTMNAYVACPQDVSGKPAIMVFQEAFGVNEHIRDVTERLAALGMVAIAPELFHRTAPGFEGRYDDFPAVREHMSALTIDGLQADIDATFGWVQRDSGCDPSAVAAIGFCLGGRVTYIANSRTQLRAAISYYGGGIAPDLLPFARSQHGPILMFWGGQDAHIPPEQYRAVADALAHGGATQEQVVFGQADHGFFCDKRASYNPIAARQAWALTREFLAAYGVLG